MGHYERQGLTRLQSTLLCFSVAEAASLPCDCNCLGLARLAGPSGPGATSHIAVQRGLHTRRGTATARLQVRCLPLPSAFLPLRHVTSDLQPSFKAA